MESCSVRRISGTSFEYSVVPAEVGRRRRQRNLRAAVPQRSNGNRPLDADHRRLHFGETLRRSGSSSFDVVNPVFRWDDVDTDPDARRRFFVFSVCPRSVGSTSDAWSVDWSTSRFWSGVNFNKLFLFDAQGDQFGKFFAYWATFSSL
jgi:hypothetical protein